MQSICNETITTWDLCVALNKINHSRGHQDGFMLVIELFVLFFFSHRLLIIWSHSLMTCCLRPAECISSVLVENFRFGCWSLQIPVFLAALIMHNARRYTPRESITSGIFVSIHFVLLSLCFVLVIHHRADRLFVF